MLSFKEYILIEKAHIIGPPKYTSKTPISVNARNFNVARVELVKSVTADVSKVPTNDTDDALRELRGLYDIRNGNLYLMFGRDGIHMLILDAFNIPKNKAIHLYFVSTNMEITSYSDGVTDHWNDYSEKEIKKWQKDIKKWVGSRFTWIGPAFARGVKLPRGWE